MLENTINKIKNLNNGLKIVYFLLIVSNLYFYYLLIKNNVVSNLFANFSLDLLLWFVEVILITGLLTVIGIKIKGKRDKTTTTGILIYMLIFTVLGIFGSYFVVSSNAGGSINIRDAIMIIGTISGGPIGGIGSGILAGIWRYSLGGVTAFSCTIATIIAPIIGSIIYYLNDKKITLTQSAILMFLYMGLDMLIIILTTNINEIYLITCELYLPMLIGTVLSVVTYYLSIEFGK